MVRPGAVVVDVGTTPVSDRARVAELFGDGSSRLAAFDKKGSTVVGDVHPAVAEVAGALSPVPGGIGPLTIAMLLKNTLAGGDRKSASGEFYVGRKTHPSTFRGRGRRGCGPIGRPYRLERRQLASCWFTKLSQSGGCRIGQGCRGTGVAVFATLVETRPRPVFSSFHELCAKGIALDVPTDRQELARRVERRRLDIVPGRRSRCLRCHATRCQRRLCMCRDDLHESSKSGRFPRGQTIRWK